MAVCEFGIAINKKRKGEDKACFLNVVSFNKTAEFVQKYFQKGSEILIEGEHDYSTWEDKETSKKRSSIQIIANQVNFVGKREDNSQQSNNQQQPTQQNNSYQAPPQGNQQQVGGQVNNDTEDDIPF